MLMAHRIPGFLPKVHLCRPAAAEAIGGSRGQDSGRIRAGRDREGDREMPWNAKILDLASKMIPSCQNH